MLGDVVGPATGGRASSCSTACTASAAAIAALARRRPRRRRRRGAARCCAARTDGVVWMRGGRRRGARRLALIRRAGGAPRGRARARRGARGRRARGARRARRVPPAVRAPPRAHGVRRLGAAGSRAGSRPTSPASRGGRWYAGRPLLVTENDYGLRLYNGDTGVVVAGAGGAATAAFERRGEVVPVSPTPAARGRDRLRDDDPQDPGLAVRHRRRPAARRRLADPHPRAALHRGHARARAS